MLMSHKSCKIRRLAQVIWVTVSFVATPMSAAEIIAPAVESTVSLPATCDLDRLTS